MCLMLTSRPAFIKEDVAVKSVDEAGILNSQINLGTVNNTAVHLKRGHYGHYVQMDNLIA